MKRKIACIILSITLTLPMIGRSEMITLSHYDQENSDHNEKNEEIDRFDDEESKGTSASDESDIDNSSVEEETEEDTSVKAEEGFSNGDRVVIRPHTFTYDYADEIFIFEHDGSYVQKYDINDIYEHISDDEAMYTFSYMNYCDGVLFYGEYLWNDTEKKARLIAYDYESKEIEPVIDWCEAEMAYLEIYEGIVYVFFCDYANEKISIRAFDKEDDSLSFNETQPKYNDLYEECSSYMMGSKWDDSLFAPLDKIIDDNGFFIGKKDEDYYVISEDVNIEKLDYSFDGESCLYYYDSESAIFQSDKDGQSQIDVYYFETGTTETIAEFVDKEGSNYNYYIDFLNLISYVDGNIYYYVYQEYELDVADYTIYKYDISTGTETELMTTTSIPGTLGTYKNFGTKFAPGLYGFTVSDGKAFYVDYKDGVTKFYTADIEDEGLSNITETDGIVNEYGFFKYGSIESLTYQEECPDCGAVFKQYHVEYLVLDEKCSDNADKINDLLKEYAQDTIDYFKDDVSDNGSCDEHKDGNTTYYDSYSEHVIDVGVLEKKYLYITVSTESDLRISSRDFEGRGQYLFDIETGEELSLEDFYDGTEDEFKTLIADKAVQDFEKGYDVGTSPYGVNTSEEVYDLAYENAQVDGNIIFYEDGIVYFFYQYVFGEMYGEIRAEYFITYDELLGRPTLSK
jgi:WD40 repeat protein